jgi:alpha-methylacyl-CoA racemase
MGPLSGIRVVEFEAIGPGPFAGMLLADMGADVLIVDRPAAADLGLKRARKIELMNRGKRSITLDMKSSGGVEAALALVARADALIEGFRPGVMERLGIGPDVALARNPKLVYGRMTGWGQDGPMAPRAGHDINYIALAGVLGAFGRQGQAPVPPLNLVGDFGGGGMLLGFGIACALVEALRSGNGQVVDAAMVEGASLLATMFSGMLHAKQWNEERGTNVLDTGAPWYDVYRTRDGQYVSICAIEARVYAELIERLGLAGEALPKQHDRAGWPVLRERFAQVFASRTRGEWVRAFEGSDACFAPVLSFSEARREPHNVARASYVTVGGIGQPAPAPKFSRTRPEVRRQPPERGEGGRQALLEWGFSAAEIEKLKVLGLGFGA